jgi:putative tryptophan/tyrosine transport system substrate-binding protein
VRRRLFLGVLGAAAVWPFVARAQSSSTIRRIGFLGNSTPELEANLVGPFRQELRALGYEEGRNIRIEYRWANGDYSRFPQLVAELLAAGVEVIVTAGTPATLAVKQATRTVPLVMIAVGDPVGTGVVPSLARPGGNITGLSSTSPDLEGKRLELLKEILPNLSYVGILRNPSNPFHITSMKQARPAAQSMGIKLLVLDVVKTDDLNAAFAQILKERPGALLVLADRVFLHNRNSLMEFAMKYRLPTMNPYRELLQAGGLVSYGPSYEDMHKRAADYVDKILKGTKAGELPVEQPTKFILRINLKTAKVLGLNIPPRLLALSDEAIE